MSSYWGHTGLHTFATIYDWVCAYCKRRTHCHACEPDASLLLSATRDHIVARANGGTSTVKNLILACWDCNHAKGVDPPPPELLPARAPALPKPRRITHLTQPIWRACGEGWHKTEQQAVVAAEALLTATGRPFQPHRCGFCQRWHIEPVAEPAALP